MKKATEAIINEYVSLVGGKTWEIVKHHGKGKWYGQIGYCICIDGSHTIYIATGMANFERRINENLDEFKQFEKNKEYYLKLLQEQAKKDNVLAKDKGLHTIKVIDIGQVSPEAKDSYFFNKCYVLLEVNGKQFKHHTTNLEVEIRKNTLKEYLEKRNNSHAFIAGAVKLPDYVFCNVFFSSTDEFYKI